MRLPPIIRADRPFVEGDDPRASVNELGYAFLPGALDPALVRRLRLLLLGHIAGGGWLAPGSDPELAVPGPAIHDDTDLADYLSVYRALQATEEFHALGHEPSLVGAIEQILGEPAFSLPLKMARIKFPVSREVKPPTPAHQDYRHIQGSFDTLTAWLPLADTRAGEGRLAVLAGSHRLGLRDLPDRPIEVEALGLEWHSSDFRAGDVLVFHSLAVHGAEDHPPDAVRVTVDFRYQPVADPVNPLMLDPHYQPAAWDELYAGWASTTLQRYWERLPLAYVDYTPDGDDLLERARNGTSRFCAPAGA
jgi:hypothetical protein